VSRSANGLSEVFDAGVSVDILPLLCLYFSLINKPYIISLASVDDQEQLMILILLAFLCEETNL